MIPGIPVLGVNPCGKFHVHVHLNGGLWIGHDGVGLVKGPIKKDAKDNEKLDCKPYDYRCVGFIVVCAKFLLPTMKVEPCLVLCDFSCC
jgi:hypothetical protein